MAQSGPSIGGIRTIHTIDIQRFLIPGLFFLFVVFIVEGVSTRLSENKEQQSAEQIFEGKDAQPSFMVRVDTTQLNGQLLNSLQFLVEQVPKTDTLESFSTATSSSRTDSTKTACGALKSCPFFLGAGLTTFGGALSGTFTLIGLLIVAFVIGHIFSSISNIVIDRIIFGKIILYPYKKLYPEKYLGPNVLHGDQEYNLYGRTENQHDEVGPHFGISNQKHERLANEYFPITKLSYTYKYVRFSFIGMIFSLVSSLLLSLFGNYLLSIGVFVLSMFLMIRCSHFSRRLENKIVLTKRLWTSKWKPSVHRDWGASYLTKLFGIDTTIDDRTLHLFEDKFKKRFNNLEPSEANSEVYWLPYSLVRNSKCFNSALLTYYIREALFTSTIATTSFILFVYFSIGSGLIYGIHDVTLQGPKIFYYVITLLFSITFIILTFRSYYVYNRLYNQHIVRVFAYGLYEEGYEAGSSHRVDDEIRQENT